MIITILVYTRHVRDFVYKYLVWQLSVLCEYACQVAATHCCSFVFWSRCDRNRISYARALDETSHGWPLLLSPRQFDCQWVRHSTLGCSVKCANANENFCLRKCCAALTEQRYSTGAETVEDRFSGKTVLALVDARTTKRRRKKTTKTKRKQIEFSCARRANSHRSNWINA